MRVLMISDVYFPRVNGVSTSIRTFRRDLEAGGCEVDLLVPAYPQDWHDDPGTTRVASLYLPCDPEDRLMRPAALARAGRGLPARYDVVHVHTPFLAHRHGVKIARRLGVPVVESYHTLFEEYLHHYVRGIPRVLSRTLARRISVNQCDSVDTVISPSLAMADRLRDYGVGSPIEVIPTGLCLDAFEGGDGADFRAQLGIAGSTRVMLYVGRVAFEKNIAFLLDVVEAVNRQWQDVVLVIAGDGPARKELESRVRGRGMASMVRFVGYLDRESTLLDCYRAADLFVFASHTETQGLVLLEAMACELPVLAMPVMGVAEFVDGQDGIVPASLDVMEFAATAIRLLESGDALRARGRAARAYVQRQWSSEVMAARMMDTYRRVTSRRGNAPAASDRRAAAPDG